MYGVGENWSMECVERDGNVHALYCSDGVDRGVVLLQILGIRLNE